jgi:single-strand DNA-binding protein
VIILVNNVVLVGRLARDPELKYTAGGTAFARFRVAVDRQGQRDDSGEKVTDWIDVVAWDKQAEFVGNYLARGNLVSVEGRIQTRSWQTQDGQSRWSVDVRAFRVQALESRAQRESRQAAATPAAEPGPPLEQDMEPMPDEGDPFADQ